MAGASPELLLCGTGKSASDTGVVSQAKICVALFGEGVSLVWNVSPSVTVRVVRWMIYDLSGGDLGQVFAVRGWWRMLARRLNYWLFGGSCWQFLYRPARVLDAR